MCHALWLFALMSAAPPIAEPRPEWPSTSQPTAALAPLQYLGKEGSAKTAQYLASLRVATGGYATQLGSSPTLAATFQARKALKVLGVKAVQPELDTAFVRKCVEPGTNYFVTRPGEKSTVMTSAGGIMTAVAVGLGDVADFKPVLEANSRRLQLEAKSYEEIRLSAAAFEALGEEPRVRREWIHQLRKTQGNDGGYGPENSRLRDTGGVIAAFLRLGETIPDREKQVYLEYFLESQKHGGGFGMTVDSPSDMDSTYKVGRAIWLMRESPNVQKLTAFLKKCHTANGGFADRPGDEPTLSDTYKAVLVSSWLKEKP